MPNILFRETRQEMIHELRSAGTTDHRTPHAVAYVHDDNPLVDIPAVPLQLTHGSLFLSDPCRRFSCVHVRRDCCSARVRSGFILRREHHVQRAIGKTNARGGDQDQRGLYRNVRSAPLVELLLQVAFTDESGGNDEME